MLEAELYMLMFVLDDPNQLDAILDAWEAIGVTGVTFIESSGLYRRQAQRANVPFMLGFHRLVGGNREGHYTLFAIVEQEIIPVCIEAAEKVVGDLSEPQTGVLAAWPLPVIKGAPKRFPTPEGE